MTEKTQNSLLKAPVVLLVGDYMWPWYQEACAEGLQLQGCKVERFGWFNDFFHLSPKGNEPIYHSFLHRVQFRLMLGPILWEICKKFIEFAKQTNPDIVWFYNVQMIPASTVKKLRKILPNAIFCQYANDNPFSKTAKLGLWRHFLASIPYFDVHFAFRHSNIQDYLHYGAKNVHLMRAYFITTKDFPEPIEKIPHDFKCDVVFAGHYENDGRVEMLEAICDAGYQLKIYGGGWNAAISILHANSPLHKLFPIAPAVGEAYRFAICGAKVALCFLSTLNCDTYTRRSFQIPAMKTAMLSQYTEDLTSLFRPNSEAMFFKNKTELLDNLKLLISNPDIRLAIAEAGYRRVYADGHDVGTRMKVWLEVVLQFKTSAG